MIPLSLVKEGEDAVIRRIGGAPEMRKHLEDLGFVVGAAVTVVRRMGGSVIVNVKGSRIAISQEMSQKIMV
ncbi:MAG: ferrous iron transport protein A [Oscillospiraceae bacterium]|nr:ferrous iron transport protein A [Oscillospiraceae bacterium]